MAVPMIVKIPEPITAPIPSDVRLSHPSDFFSCFSRISESEISRSISFLRKSCAPNRHLPRERAKLYLARSHRATLRQCSKGVGQRHHPTAHCIRPRSHLTKWKVGNADKARKRKGTRIRQKTRESCICF